MAVAKAQYDLVAKDKSKKAFGSIRKSLGGLKGAIGGLGLAFGAAGFAKFIGGALDAGDEVQKLAIQTGASTEFLSEMRGVLELSGVSYGTFTKSLQKGSKAVLDAKNGSKNMVLAFEELGLSVAALDAMSPEDQFNAIGHAIASVEDPTKRTALQMTLLGGKGTEMLRLFSQGPEAIAAMREEQVKFGNSLSRDMVDKMANANDAMARLGQQMDGLGNQFAVEFAQPISDGAGVLTKILIPALKIVGNIFGLLGDVIGGVAVALVNLFTGNFSEAANAAGLAVRDLTDNFTTLLDVQAETVDRGAGGALVPALGTGKGAPQEVTMSPQAAEAFAKAQAKTPAKKDPQLKETNETLKKIDKRLEEKTVAIAG